DFFGFDELIDDLQPLIRHPRDADVGLGRCLAVRRCLRSRGGEGVEDGGLADQRQADDADFESHAAEYTGGVNLKRYAAAEDRAYNTAMTVEQFGNVHHAQPFRPFTIHMGDGRSFFVKHSNYISRSETGRTV